MRVYFHWPFCRRICPFCSFNKYSQHDGAAQIPVTAWLSAFTSELQRTLRLQDGSPSRRSAPLKSIYFGGGTPSLADVGFLEGLIADTRRSFASGEHRHDPENAPEVTLELNPDACVQPSLLQSWKLAGINRLSVGVQSLSDRHLAFLGREHSAADTISALRKCSTEFGGSRMSADFILGLPGQTPVQVVEMLQRSLEACPELGHASIYTLSVDRGTPFHASHPRHGMAVSNATKREYPQSWPPDNDPDWLADLICAAVEYLCGSCGWLRYEVSSYARTAEHISVHNSGHWDESDFAGVGPGAHGRLTIGGRRFATVQIADPARWLSAAATYTTPAPGGQSPTFAKFSALSLTEQLEELVLTGIRTAKGLSMARLRSLCTLLTHREVFDIARLLQQALAEKGIATLFQFGDSLRVSDPLALNTADALAIEVLASLETIIERTRQQKDAGQQGQTAEVQ